VFGFSFGELMVLLIVGIVVVGPKRLPSMMRTAGQWITRIRKMSSDLRSQSGIDDIIRQEGLERDIHELRSLSGGNLVQSLALGGSLLGEAKPRKRTVTVEEEPDAAPIAAPAQVGPALVDVLREREYPLIGCDAYDTLPDDAAPPPEAAPLHEGEPDKDADDEVATNASDATSEAVKAETKEELPMAIATEAAGSTTNEAAAEPAPGASP
jgi:sec-independent protein translocase protein TatB